MTDAQKMQLNKMLETLGEDITNIEDTCDSLRYFIKTINTFVDNVQEDHIEWVKFKDLYNNFLINQYKCTICGSIWTHPYNYCPNCGTNHKEI